jgi:hypothetical protein
MAFTQNDGRPPLVAASAIKAYAPIAFLAAASARSETVVAAASLNEFQFGVALATVASPGEPVSYWRHGDVAKCIAGASMGAGARVAVGSTNSVIGLAAEVAAGPTGPPKFALGVLLKNAAAGDFVPVFLTTSQVV